MVLSYFDLAAAFDGRARTPRCRCGAPQAAAAGAEDAEFCASCDCPLCLECLPGPVCQVCLDQADPPPEDE